VNAGARRSIAVTGANGFVGNAIVRALAAAGEDPIALLRPGAKMPLRGLPGEDVPVRQRRIEGWTQAELARALEGADAVVHAASIIHRRGWPASEYVKFNVDGTNALVDAAAQAGAQQLVFISSAKVYGEEPQGVVDEDTPLHPDAPYSQTKLEGERIVLARAPTPSILRLAPVYGRGDKGNVRTVLRSIERRVFFIPGDGSTRKTIVHVSTVADVVKRVLELRASGTWVVGDREAHSMRELADTCARALGRPRPRTVPAPVLYAIAKVADRAIALARRPPREVKGLVYKSMLTTIFSPRKAEAELGVSCHVDFEESIRDEVAWLRDSGQL
jgi:UDP-glucose 4-epimerase